MSTHFYSQHGRHYVVGKLICRFDNGGDRVAIKHCDEDMKVFYPNDDYDGMPFKALCVVCNNHYYAKWVGDLWQAVEVQ